MALINSHNKNFKKNQMNKKTFVIAEQKQAAQLIKCCPNNVIYQAKVSTSKDDLKVYTGSTKRTFKSRYNEHKISFPKPFKSKPKNCSQLAIHLWNLYNNNVKGNL